VARQFTLSCDSISLVLQARSEGSGDKWLTGNNSPPGRRFAARLPSMPLKKRAYGPREARSPEARSGAQLTKFLYVFPDTPLPPSELCAPEYGTKGARLGKYSGAKLTSPALQIAALSKWQSWKGAAEGGACLHLWQSISPSYGAA
jgi:hypothetical protein